MTMTHAKISAEDPDMAARFRERLFFEKTLSNALSAPFTTHVSTAVFIRPAARDTNAAQAILHSEGSACQLQENIAPLTDAGAYTN